MSDRKAVEYPDKRYRITARQGILSFVLKDDVSQTPRPTVFLDRDGVLNRRIPGGYVTRWAEFVFLPGVMETLPKLGVAGLQLAIVSNQAGVAKGFLECTDLIHITLASLNELRKAGTVVQGAFFCMHTPADACSCRKPNVGLLEEAGRALAVDFGRSFLVGDSPSDMQAGAGMGCATIYVGDGKVESIPAHYRAANIDDAVTWVLARES